MSFEVDNPRSLYEIHTANDIHTMPPAPPPTPLSASEMLLDPRLRTRSSAGPPPPALTSGESSFIYTQGHPNSPTSSPSEGAFFIYTHGHTDSPISPAGSWISTDDVAVTVVKPTTVDSQLELTTDFLSLYDDHDPMDRYARYHQDIITGIVGLIFYKSIIGSNGPISSLDLVRTLRYRNRGYAAWDSATEEVVETAFFRPSTEDRIWHDTFMRWQNLLERDCTSNSSDELKQVIVKLLADLESAEALLRSTIVDDPQAIVNNVEDEECLGGEHFEIIEEDHEDEDME